LFARVAELWLSTNPAQRAVRDPQKRSHAGS